MSKLVASGLLWLNVAHWWYPENSGNQNNTVYNAKNRLRPLVLKSCLHIRSKATNMIETFSLSKTHDMNGPSESVNDEEYKAVEIKD